MKCVNVLNIKLDVFKVNNKDKRATLVEVFLKFLLLTFNTAKHSVYQSVVFISNFKHVLDWQGNHSLTWTHSYTRSYEKLSGIKSFFFFHIEYWVLLGTTLNWIFRFTKPEAWEYTSWIYLELMLTRASLALPRSIRIIVFFSPINILWG